MSKMSYLRWNPETREIELEGTEEFIKTYFDKLQQIVPQSADEVKKAHEAVIVSSTGRTMIKTTETAETLAPEKVVQVASTKAVVKGPKKVSLINQVLGIIKESATGVTGAELRDKTGMTSRQINAITARAAKMGKIKTTKRGVYVPV